MNKSKLGMALPLSLLVLPLLMLVPAASANATIKGAGTFTATVTSEAIISQVNGYTTYLFSGPDVFTGIESGTGTAQFVILVAPNGHDVGTGNIVCSSCSIAGLPGSYTIQFASKGIFGGNGAGEFTLVGSGTLAGVTGTGAFQFTTTATGFTGPYTADISFSTPS